MMLLSCFLSYSHLLKTFPKDTNSGSFLSICLQLCFPQHTSVQGSMTAPQIRSISDVLPYILILEPGLLLYLHVKKEVFRHKFSLSFLEIWQKTKNSSFSLKLFELRRIIFLSSVCTWEGGKWGEERPFLEFLCPFLNLKCWRS